MKNWLNFFYFSKRERNGIIMLLALIFLVIAAHIILPWIHFSNENNPHNFDKEVAVFESGMIQIQKKTYASTSHYLEKSSPHLTPFVFDPNQMSMKDWKRLGLSEKQAESIKRYTAKGGRFRTPSDFAKMYCISSEEYHILASYIQIAGQEAVSSKVYPEKKPFTVLSNLADTLDLQQIKGIGPAFARRIVKYREQLGGFVAKEQLKEVYGINDDVYAGIEASFEIDLQHVRKLSINTITLQELKKHPYLDYYQAKEIIKYRETYGNFSNVEELQRVNLMDEHTYRKLKPYISVQN